MRSTHCREFTYLKLCKPAYIAGDQYIPGDGGCVTGWLHVIHEVAQQVQLLHVHCVPRSRPQALTPISSIRKLIKIASASEICLSSLNPFDEIALQYIWCPVFTGYPVSEKGRIYCRFDFQSIPRFWYNVC